VQPGHDLPVAEGFTVPNDLTRRFFVLLAAIAAIAFFVRLVPVLRGGGLFGLINYDDGVYFASALSLLRDRIPYRDFIILHPPGILYVLSPFAALSLIVSDATAFAAARLGFMALGAVNVVLVALVARPMGRGTALCAATLYAIWQVPATVERTTWLISPQNTLLLAALLVLSGASPSALRGRAVIGPRRAALVGALLGACAAIQIWGAVPVLIVLGWLIWTARDEPRHWLRLGSAYVVGAAVAAGFIVGPFLLAAGPKLIRYVVFDQIGRGATSVAIVSRLRAMEGFAIVGPRVTPVPDAVVIIVFVTVAALVAWGAWRVPAMRLWAILLAAQVAVLEVTPSFYLHYPGWAAPVAVLSIGAAAVDAASAFRVIRRAPLRRMVIGAAAALVIGALLFESLRWRVGTHIMTARIRADVAGAHCVTADSPALLIEIGMLRKVIERGCPLLISPFGVMQDTDRDLKGAARTASNRVEYQRAMANYYGSSDAALFMRLGSDALSDATWAAITERLPIEIKRGGLRIRLPG
jgi:alpha-1,2-mannosyltransferase